MNKKKPLTPETYIENYDQLNQLYDYPLINQICTNLQGKFIEVCNMQYDNILQQMSDLLEIDAQLQMFLDFFKYDFFKEIELAENEVIEMIHKDKNVYYRQLSGIGTNEKAPIGLIYLSEKDMF